MSHQCRAPPGLQQAYAEQDAQSASQDGSRCATRQGFWTPQFEGCFEHTLTTRRLTNEAMRAIGRDGAIVVELNGRHASIRWHLAQAAIDDGTVEVVLPVEGLAHAFTVEHVLGGYHQRVAITDGTFHTLRPVDPSTRGKTYMWLSRRGRTIRAGLGDVPDQQVVATFTAPSDAINHVAISLNETLEQARYDPPTIGRVRSFQLQFAPS